MKKSLFLTVLLTAAFAVCAQDTLHTTQPPDNYHYTYWHHHKLGDTLYCNMTEKYYDDHFKGLVCSTGDKITVYGIAFGAIIKYPNPCYNSEVWDSIDSVWSGVDPEGFYDSDSVWHWIGDSSLVESYMDFYVVQATTNGNGYTVSDTVRLHLEHDTAAYYVDMEFTYDPPERFPCPPFPVYEKYFKKPPLVGEIFYIGGINHSAERCAHGSGKYPEIKGVSWGADGELLMFSNVYQRPTGLFERSSGQGWQWFFPILTPNPDSTFYIPDSNDVPGDSTQTSIRTGSWERYVSLQPNPATDEATVLSSFGIDEVEVYDMAGGRVLLQQASGLKARLDVKALPRGTYIVRIHTPLGITSRKLVMQ